jgi:electron transport complex protein RnfG
MIARAMWRNALLLSAFAAVTTGMVVAFNQLTASRIEASRQQELVKTLNALTPAGSYDNDLLRDALPLPDAARLGHTVPETAWRAFRGGRVVAVLYPVIARDGYSGRIRLLVAVGTDGRLAGVRVLAHRETPGLGDAIEVEKSDWIRAFDGKSLSDPRESGWKVRKDGGQFDQFSGATITPRAVVSAVHEALRYFQDHRQSLLAPAQAIPETP